MNDIGDFRAYSAPVHWPRNPHDLTDLTLCPACHTPLGAAACWRCGLDLTHPSAGELATISERIAAEFSARENLIGRIRYDALQQASQLAAQPVSPQTAPPLPEPAPQPAASAPQPASPQTAASQWANPHTIAPEPTATQPGPQPAAPATVAPAETPASPSFAAPSPVPPTPAPMMPPPPVATTYPAPPAAPLAAPPAEARPTGRSAVQVALLITGISLLSIFAIFFLVYSFITWGLTWRSIIIGLITVSAFAAADLLRDRKLTASSEAIATFALLLVYLDAFALRANGLLGLDQIDGALYWGVVMLGSALAFIGWYRLRGIRVANIVGYGMLAPGAGVLVGAILQWGLMPHLYIVGLTMAAIGLAQRTALRAESRAHLERGILLGLAVLGSALALLSTQFLNDGWPTLALLGVALVAAAQVASLATPAARIFERGFGAVFGVVAGLATAIAAFSEPVRLASLGGVEQPWLVGILPVAVIAVIWLWFLQRFSAARDETVLIALGSATATAGVVTGLAAIPLALNALTRTVEWPLYPLHSLREITAATTHEVTLATLIASSSLLGLLVLAGVAIRIRPSWRTLAPALTVTAAAALLTLPPLLPTLGLGLAGWLLIGTVGLTLLSIPRAHRLRRAAFVTAISGFALAFAAGWAGSDTWLPISVITVIALITARLLHKGLTLHATLSGIATALLYLIVVTVIEGPALLNSALTPTVVLLLSGGLLLGMACLPWLDVVERRVVYWMSGSFGLIAALWMLAESPSHAEPLPIMAAALTLLATALWAHLPNTRALAPERLASRAVAAPALLLLIAMILRGTGTPAAFALGLTLLISSALGVILAATARRIPQTSAASPDAPGSATAVTRASDSGRLAGDLGVALVGLLAFVTVLAQALRPAELSWLLLLAGALSLVMCATSADGIFGSASPRRHLIWVALGVGVACLWLRLAESSVTALEPYVLPPAAALLVFAFLDARARRRAARGSGDATARDRSSAALTLSGMLLAVLPLAITSTASIDARSTLLFVACLLLLLVGLVRVPAVLKLHRDAAALAGLIGTVISTLALGLTATRDGGYPVEAWLVPAVIALAVVAVVRGRATAAALASGARMLGQVLLVTALLLVTAVEMTALTADDDGTARILALLCLLSLVHVLAFAWPRPPLTPLVAWLALGLAGVAMLVAIAIVPTLELATVPPALALIASGSIHLHRVAAARSWPWLGPGVALLLLPSLLATIDDRPGWRLVGLGLLAVAVIVVGATRRLQAPFLLGVIVALIHGLATFSPQIRAVYQFTEWYVWAGVGGVLLIALAIRYERRIRDLKRAVSSIQALR